MRDQLSHRRNSPYCAKCGGTCDYDDDGNLRPPYKEHDADPITGLREIIAELNADRELLRQALTELELRTRQFISGELVSFPASLLPQVRALLRKVQP